MTILNPGTEDFASFDDTTRRFLTETVRFFEDKGKARLKEDDRQRTWYADFLDFQKKFGAFATTLTPAGYGADDARWDTRRNNAFAEILGFYGLAYWYTWQVSVLGLGPIWMSGSETVKNRAAALLEDGAIFAFGLSERDHGADVYSTDMVLAPTGDGTYSASGGKYYIGNANQAAMVSVFGRVDGTDDYVFFVADSRHERFRLIRNVVNSQSYVAEFELDDYPVTDDDIIHRGDDAWNAALNTVNIGKFNLGWASIGICTHAFYEAITHAANRHLYGMTVTDFPHVQSLFVDAYTRLAAMRMVASRATDYLRTASDDDRRYLLYNPIVKMKVTTEGERVIDALWDVIAAKGFEADMYFEMAARDIRALPKLEGTVHVNVALIAKFMENYFGEPDDSLPDIAPRHGPDDDGYLFRQAPTRGLGKIRFPEWRGAFADSAIPTVQCFAEQADELASLLAACPPDDAQRADPDFLLCVGEIFTLVVYGRLVLEQASLNGADEDLVGQIFDVLVRDVAAAALTLHQKPAATEAQQARCRAMMVRPPADPERFGRVWADVLALDGAYEMPD